MGEIREYGNLRKANPQQLLKYFSANAQSGCLRLFSNSMAWAVYLEQGKITYATHSGAAAPSDRLSCHLLRLSDQGEVKVSAIEQLRRILKFIDSKKYPIQAREYRAIDSLVIQEYLTNFQASALVEGLTKEAIVPLLLITGVTYEFKCGLDTLLLPKFCELALSPTLEHCQKQLQDWQSQPSLYGTKPPYNQLPKTIAHSPKVDKSVDVTVSTPTAISDVQQRQIIRRKIYTVACVDDSQAMLNAINMYLADESLKPELINDPVKALMQIIRLKPDLILLDIGMPCIDGYELCRLVRHHSLFKNTPIIMVTGSKGIIDRVKARIVGASGYLTKPFNQADLLKTVFTHLH